MGESDRIELLEGPVEMAAVENCARAFHAQDRFAAHFIGHGHNFRRKIHRRFDCGKVVDCVWTWRQNFGYFSLAPGVSFRQNPAAQLILSRLRISILRDAAREGCAPEHLASDCPDQFELLAWREAISTAFPHRWKLR